MLKIICEHNDDGTGCHQIETGGPMLDILADLGYGILAIYQNIQQVDKDLAEAFRAEFLHALNNPRFWRESVLGDGATSICSIIPNKNA